MMKSTHARPVLVHPHHALACGESRPWATDSNKSTSVETLKLEARFRAIYRSASNKCHSRHVGRPPLHFLSLTTTLAVSNVNEARKQHPWRELKQTYGECAVRRCPGRENARAGRKNIVTRSFTRICPATAGENSRGDRTDASVFDIQPHEPDREIHSLCDPPLLVFHSFVGTTISLKGNSSYKHGTVTPNTYTLSSRLAAATSRQTVANTAPSKRTARAYSENDPASALPSWAPR
jgi:hypothetical protein